MYTSQCGLWQSGQNSVRPVPGPHGLAPADGVCQLWQAHVCTVVDLHWLIRCRFVISITCHIRWVCPIGYVLLGMSYWVCPIGYVLLGMSYWVCPIGYVLLGMSYWVCPIGYVLLSIYGRCSEINAVMYARQSLIG